MPCPFCPARPAAAYLGARARPPGLRRAVERERRRILGRSPTVPGTRRSPEAESSLLFGFSERDLNPNGGPPAPLPSLGPRTRSLARSGASPPPPRVHPARDAAKPSSPKPSRSGPPHSEPELERSSPRSTPSPRPHARLRVSLGLMHAPTSARPAPVPSGSRRLPAAPTSFPAPPLAPGASRFRHPEAAHSDSPCRAGGLGPSRARERCPGAGAAALVTTRGGSHPAGPSAESAPRAGPRCVTAQRRPARCLLGVVVPSSALVPALPTPPGTCSPPPGAHLLQARPRWGPRTFP